MRNILVAAVTNAEELPEPSNELRLAGRLQAPLGLQLQETFLQTLQGMPQVKRAGESKARLAMQGQLAGIGDVTLAACC